MVKYQQLYEELKNDIENGKYLPGDWLPSETQLRIQYNIGRDTVRKGLNLLAAAGYIQKEQGKGSKVLKIEKQGVLQDLAAYPYLPEEEGFDTIVREVKLIMPTKEISRHMGLAEKKKIWKITKLRTIDDQPAVLETDYVDPDLVPDLDLERAETAPWQLTREVTGLDISYSRKEITLRKPTAGEIKVLKLKDPGMLAVVRSWTYLEDTRQLQYTVARHNPACFRYTDFLRTKTGL